MAREAEQGRPPAATRPEIGHCAEGHVFALESGGGKALREQDLAAGVVRRNRTSRNQLLNEI
jgi:hypothetical protein